MDLDAQRGTSIPTDILEMVSNTDFGRGKSLNAIMRMMPEDQAILCDHIRNHRTVEAGIMVNNAMMLKVVQLPGNCTKEVRKQLDRLDRAWLEASDDARNRFLRRLEKRGVKFDSLLIDPRA